MGIGTHSYCDLQAVKFKAVVHVVLFANTLQLWVQLQTIYVLEGLGPPKEHAPGTRSFKDQVRLSCPIAFVCLSFSQSFACVLVGLRYTSHSQMSLCVC